MNLAVRPTRSIWRQIRKCPVEAAWLIEASEASAEIRGGPYAAVGVLAGTISPRALMAVVYRMTAFGNAMRLDRIQGWAVSADNSGHITVQKSVFEAAARCSIEMVDGFPEFEPNEFFRLTLQYSENGGNG